MLTSEEVFKGKHTQAYMVLILIASLVFTLWKYIFKRMFVCIEFCCFSDKNLQVVDKKNVATDSNFYNCINFATLRQELYVVQQSLESFMNMYRKQTFNEVYLSSSELKQYIVSLMSRREQIVKRITEIAEIKLGK